MMKSSVEKVLERMNELEATIDKLVEKSYDAYQAGNIKKAEFYDRKTDAAAIEREAYRKCLKTLGFGVWRTDKNEWVIPLDDIEKLCP